jgi:hypothetical protein
MNAGRKEIDERKKTRQLAKFDGKFFSQSRIGWRFKEMPNRENGKILDSDCSRNIMTEFPAEN